MQRRVQPLTPPTQAVVHKVSHLVPHIKDDLVLWGVEHIVQRHSEVCDPQAGSQVPSSVADGVDHVLPDLLGQLLELAAVEILDVDGIIDGVQQGRSGATGCLNKVLQGQRGTPVRDACEL